MKVKCPACGSVFEAAQTAVASVVRCRCGQALKLPAKPAAAARGAPPFPPKPASAAAKSTTAPSGGDRLPPLFDDDDLDLMLDVELPTSASSGATKLRPLAPPPQPPPKPQPLPKPKRSSSASGVSWSIENNGWLQMGVWLLILGVASFILPMFGLQIRRLERLGPNAPILGGILGFIGAACLYVSQANQPTLGLLMSGSGAIVMALVWLIVGLPKPHAPGIGPRESGVAQRQSFSTSESTAPQNPAPSNTPPGSQSASATQAQEEARRYAEAEGARISQGLEEQRRAADERRREIEERHREIQQRHQEAIDRMRRGAFGGSAFEPPHMPDESIGKWPTRVEASAVAADASSLPQLGPPEEPLPLFNYSEDDIQPVILKSSHGNGGVDEDLAPEGAVLIGLRIATGEGWGGAVRGVQPIYQNADSYREGQWCGNQAEQLTLLLAKPGYVIGNIRVRAGLVIDAIQAAFVAVKDGELQPDDQYSSEWIGGAGGGEQPHPDKPSFIVGLAAGAGDDFESLGFYAVAEVKVEDPAAEEKPASKLRNWTSADGKFTVEAELVATEAGRAVLRKQDGKLVRVPIDKLSEEDQRFIDNR